MIFEPKDKKDICKELKKRYDGKNMRLSLKTYPLIDEYLKTFTYKTTVYDWIKKCDIEVDASIDAINSIFKLTKKMNGDIHVIESNPFEPIYKSVDLMNFLWVLHSTKTIQHHNFWLTNYEHFPFKRYVNDEYIYIERDHTKIFFVNEDIINKYFYPNAYNVPTPDLSLSKTPLDTRIYLPFVAKNTISNKKIYKRNKIVK